MASFILPAGSVVKFGCLSTALYPALRQGIAPDVPRCQFQLGAQLLQYTQSKGIDIGELMAYFGACMEFIDATSQLHDAHQDVMANFVEALQQAHGEKPRMPELEAIAAQAGLPVILEIQLQEDCEMQCDERFVSDDNAELSWKQWRSGRLQTSNGVPAAWIKQFYFPRLLDFRDVSNTKNPRSLEQTTDAALLVGGLMQAWHKDSPGELLLAFRRQYKRVNFSQSSPFNDTALERFFNLNAMLDPATRLLNQMTLWQDIMALARKQSIPLAE